MSKLPGDIRDVISRLVAEGFTPDDEILAYAVECAEESEIEVDAEVRSAIEQTTAELLKAHRTEQEHWATPTDCDRLDSAFSALNAQGIVARQHFACCNNCGHTEIWDEIEEAEKAGKVAGYAFHHFQSTESAMDTGRLYLAYGSVEENEEALTTVGNTIVAALKETGLNAHWNGDAHHAILVEDIVWQKRR